MGVSVCSWECVFVLMWARLWACLLMNACAGIWTCVQVACESGLLGLCSQLCMNLLFFPAVRVRFLSTVWLSLQEVLPQSVGSWSQDPELNGGVPLACMVHRVCSHRCLWAQDVHRMSAAWPGPTHTVVGGWVQCRDTCKQPGMCPSPQWGQSACPWHPQWNEGWECACAARHWAECRTREKPQPLFSPCDSVACVSFFICVSPALSLALYPDSFLCFFSFLNPPPSPHTTMRSSWCLCVYMCLSLLLLVALFLCASRPSLFL